MLRLSSIVLVSIVLSGCAGLPGPAPAPIRASKLEHLTKPGDQIPDYKIIQEDLERSRNSIELIPVTPAYSASTSVRTIEDKAFKEKWTKEKTAAELKKKLKNEPVFDKQTCFLMTAETSDADSKDESSWHFTLETEGKKYTAKAMKFDGFEQDVTTFIYGSGYTSTEYTLISSICFPVKTDFTKTFSVLVEPRYQRDIEPTYLQWTGPTETKTN